MKIIPTYNVLEDVLKIAIISDVHSNLEALQEVLADITRQKTEHIFCLGDIVGYGANPRECLILIMHCCNQIIRGNHEEGVIFLEFAKIHLNDLAYAGVRYSRKILHKKERTFLRTLPKHIVFHGMRITLAHGAYTESFKYLDEEEKAFEELKYTPTKLTFVGHTHVPFVFGSDDGLIECLPDNLDLNGEQKYLINVGSVGQPRDGDCRASYGLLDINGEAGKETYRFTLNRVFYNIQKTQDAMRKARLPLALSERLFRGE